MFLLVKKWYSVRTRIRHSTSKYLDLLPSCKCLPNQAIVHCHWKDGMLWEWTGHPPSYAEAKKILSLLPFRVGLERKRCLDPKWLSLQPLDLDLITIFLTHYISILFLLNVCVNKPVPEALLILCSSNLKFKSTL